MEYIHTEGRDVVRVFLCNYIRALESARDVVLPHDDGGPRVSGIVGLRGQLRNAFDTAVVRWTR